MAPKLSLASTPPSKYDINGLAAKMSPKPKKAPPSQNYHRQENSYVLTVLSIRNSSTTRSFKIACATKGNSVPQTKMLRCQGSEIDLCISTTVELGSASLSLDEILMEQMQRLRVGRGSALSSHQHQPSYGSRHRNITTTNSILPRFSPPMIPFTTNNVRPVNLREPHTKL